jgi:hypothetical protein
MLGGRARRRSASTFSAPQIRELERVARSLSVQTQAVEAVNGSTDLEDAFEKAKTWRADALVVLSNPLNLARPPIVADIRDLCRKFGDIPFVTQHDKNRVLGGPGGCLGAIRLAAGSNRERTGGSRTKACRAAAHCRFSKRVLMSQRAGLAERIAPVGERGAAATAVMTTRRRTNVASGIRARKR